MKQPPIVKVIYLEAKPDGSKVDLDEYFASGHTLAELLAHATTTLRRSPEQEYEFPYRETPHGLVWLKPTRDGAVETPLCNFTARILADRLEDDGVETRRTFEIEARQNSRTATLHVVADRFNSLNWVTEALGSRAVLAPGQSVRDHTRTAIQRFSEATERRVYTHLGWRHVNEQWVYLHADGAIGEAGSVPDVEVAVPSALERFALPEPLQGEALTTAIRASLHMLTVAPHAITFLLLAAVYRAVLGNTDLAVHLAGPTGVGKSELAALAQQHYGAELDARQLPASWTSTGNFLEGLAFTAKDALLVVDDFAPTGSTSDVQRFHRDADRVFRAQGNRSGRGRMSSEARLKAAKPPRGMVLSTGEDIPRGQSLRARVFIVEPSPGDVDWRVLSTCQRDAAGGLYAQSLAGFLRWIAPQYETIKKRLRSEVEELRAYATQNGHKRTPEIVANLALGFRYFICFAHEIAAISPEEQETLWESCWESLSTAASAQSQHQEANEPAARFLELVNAALASGKAHLASPTGGWPVDPESWGWRFDGDNTGWKEKGARIGWIDGEDLYLQPDASYAAAQELSRSQGDSLPVSAQTIRRRLKERNLLASWDKATQTTTVRRTLEGKQQSVLHLRKSIFQEGLYSHKKPSKPSKPTEGAETADNSPPNAGFSETQQEAKPSKPSTDPASKSEVKSGTNGVNAGFAGFNRGVEGLPRETKNGSLFEGKTDAGFAGSTENQNPASANQNPALDPEEGESPEFLVMFSNC